MRATIDECCNNNIIPFRYIKCFVARNCKIIIYNDDEPSFVHLNRFKMSSNFNKILSTVKNLTVSYISTGDKIGYSSYKCRLLGARKCRYSKLKAANNIRPYTIAELSEV